jgi:hypothetical protein
MRDIGAVSGSRMIQIEGLRRCPDVDSDPEHQFQTRPYGLFDIGLLA